MAAKRPGTGSGKRPVHHPESTARITEARPQFNGGGPVAKLGRTQGEAAREAPKAAVWRLSWPLRGAEIRAPVQNRFGTYISGGIGPR